jgi:hypothetical protein
MKSIITAIAVLLTLGVSAQTYVGAKVGPSFTRLKYKTGAKDFYTLSNSFGAFIEHGYSKGMVIGAELLFENRRSKVDNNPTDNLGNPLPSASMHHGFYTASMPLYVGFKSTLKTVYISATLGVIPALSLTEYFVLKGYPNDELNKRSSFSSSHFDLSPIVNLGAGVSVKRLQIGLQSRYQQSVIGITTAGAKTNAISAFLSVGYKL